MNPITSTTPAALAAPGGLLESRAHAVRQPAAWRRFAPLAVWWLGALVALGGQGAAAAPVALSSSIGLSVEVQSDMRVAPVADQQRFNPADSLTDARVTASAYSVTQGGDGSALATIELQSDWNGPSQGSLGWNVQMGGHETFGGQATYVGNRWAYRFETAADSLLSMDFSVTDDPVVDPFGGYFNLRIDGVRVDTYYSGTSGVRSYRLGGAGTHEVAVELNGRIMPMSSFHDSHFGMGAFFAWAIEDVNDGGHPSAVPEPAGWLLVATAMLALSVARRRGRR